jgi:hypothetical protein
LSSLEATLAQERWRRAVDNLWREVVYYRKARLAQRERERADKRLRNLRRIVRHALSEYHRIAVERLREQEVERQRERSSVERQGQGIRNPRA